MKVEDDASSPALPELWVIAGPTASGKSALALALAKRLGGELVNADSVQVYRGFDIGAAKPSAAEQAEVRHHLIDTLTPNEQWTAADFAREADSAVDDIRARGKVAIVVGGSGLYLRAWLEGLADAPPADPAVRARWEREAADRGLAALWETLRDVDAVSAAKIHPNDRVRIVRAMEIWTLTGETRSALFRRQASGAGRRDAFGVALDLPRDVLYARINERCEAMFERGLIAEVRGLLEAGVSPEAAPFAAIGYREVLRAVEGRDAWDGLRARVAKATRTYARRQITWFRRQSQLMPWRPPLGPACAGAEQLLQEGGAWLGRLQAAGCTGEP